MLDECMLDECMFDNQKSKEESVQGRQPGWLHPSILKAELLEARRRGQCRWESMPCFAGNSEMQIFLFGLCSRKELCKSAGHVLCESDCLRMPAGIWLHIRMCNIALGCLYTSSWHVSAEGMAMLSLTFFHPSFLLQSCLAWRVCCKAPSSPIANRRADLKFQSALMNIDAEKPIGASFWRLPACNF